MIQRIRNLMLAFFGICGAISSLRAEGREFSSDLLRQAVETLHLQQCVDTIAGGSQLVSDADAGLLRVGCSHGQLVHLGRPLFAEQLYNPTLPICDYLEFAVLDHQKHISDNPFLYKNLSFRTGDWALLEQVTPAIPCQLSSEEGIRYVVSWQLEGNKEVTVEVPVEYDRLALMSRNEIEQLFLHEMQSYLSSDPLRATVTDTTLMQRIGDDMWALPGETYILSAINQHTYYRQNAAGEVELVCDSLSAAETIANLVNARSEDLPSVTMDVSFLNHEYQNQSFRISLSDFLSFCETKGCVAYWGLESIEGSLVAGSIYLDNRTSGYLHVVRLKTDVAQLLESSAKASARVSLFIPTNNIENLFQEYVPGKKKARFEWR